MRGAAKNGPRALEQPSRERGLRPGAFGLLRWDRRHAGGEADLVRLAAWAETASPHALEAARLHLEAETQARQSTTDALLWMLEHVIEAWLKQGAAFKDYADFNRDHFRCTAPGCTARRSLQSHHIVRRSAGGPDEPWNRTTLCAFHHLRGIHAGTMRCSGRAPEGLAYALGVQANGPPLLRARAGDMLLSA
jgi:hypothetical protein